MWPKKFRKTRGSSRTNNQIKYYEAERLHSYLDTINKWDELDFIMIVTSRLGVKFRRFYNWKYMSCRIPTEAKKVMNEVARVNIFEFDDNGKPIFPPSNHDKQRNDK